MPIHHIYQINILNQNFLNLICAKFWETMRKWSKNNIVVISEREAPKDFKKVWCSKLGVTHHGVLSS